jgi:signal transduction histidine kinase
MMGVVYGLQDPSGMEDVRVTRGAEEGMKRKEKGSVGLYPSFVQPLIVGLFCLLLVSLFFVSALMDVRRTENTLMDVFENKGVTIIETVEMIAQNNLKGLMGLTNRSAVSFQDLETIEEGFRLQEFILNRLTELGREVGRRDGEGTLTSEYLKGLADEAELLAIAVFDGQGNPIAQSPPVPETVSPRIQGMLQCREEIVLDMQGEGTGERLPYLVGLRRKNADGLIVLVLDGEGLHYWASRVALQEAVEEGGWRKGVHYFEVVDFRGRLVAGAGDLPEAGAREGRDLKAGEIRFDKAVSSRRMIEHVPELLEASAPLRLNGRDAGIARVGLEIDEVGRLKKRNERHILFSTALMMAGAVLAVLLLYRIQSRHQRRLQEMAERLFHAERLSSLGRLAAGVAHEIRNPLNAIGMAIQRIQREFAPPETDNRNEFTQLVSVVREEIRRLNQIIEDFVGPARKRPAEFRPERLTDLLDRVVQLVQEEAESRGIRIQCEWEDPDIVAQVDSARMHQALFNLVKNALESIVGQGTVTISVRSRGTRRALVSIRDTGVGIPPEAIRRIFDFEYTTKEKGLGLGLPMAREIIQAHGWEIRVESRPGKGSSFEISIPIWEN